MGKDSKIEWTDHTFNPWIGCTKVSPGCENCYAERDNKRFKWNPEGWGPGKARKRTSDTNWMKPFRWNEEAERDGTRPRVFCGSLCDVFDQEVDYRWRCRLYALIKFTPNLEWLLLTKRIDSAWIDSAWIGCSFDNVRVGITVCNQEEADKDIPKLLKLGVPNFLSIEPMLGSIDISGMFYTHNFIKNEPWEECPTWDDMCNCEIDWLILGGESGPNARPMHPDWARSIRDQCQRSGVPFFFKQMSGRAPIPDDLMIREFPE